MPDGHGDVLCKPEVIGGMGMRSMRETFASELYICAVCAIGSIGIQRHCTAEHINM